jgi:hypothetical protein
VYVCDVVSNITTWASTNARTIAQAIIGSSNIVSCNLTMSADGNYVAFECFTNPVPYAAQGVVLRYNRQSGLTDVICSNAAVPLMTLENMHNLDMTPDGRLVACVVNVGGTAPTNNTAIYLWNSQTGSNTLVSATLGGDVPTNVICDYPAVSRNGQYVAFLSNATNLVTNVLSGAWHLYIRNMTAGTTLLVDADMNGVGAGVDRSFAPGLSADGQSVVFSAQGNLAPGSDTGDYNVFLNAPFAGTTGLISTPDPALSGIGPALMWPADAGLTYQVQYEDNLAASNWQGLIGPVNVVGKHGYAADLAPPGTQRFYRVVGH